jgi:hypothetical protein
MEKEFVPYEQALALKELGFDEPCMRYYWTDGMFSKTYNEPFNFSKRHCEVSAPLYQQAFRWFREKYGLFGEINLTTKQEDVDVFEFFVLSIDDCLFDDSKDYNIYEEAELECLTKLIEICKK